MAAQIKYFLYARKSREEDEKQALSIEAQLAELRDFARKENLQIIDVFTEAKTARKPGRSVFNQMIKKIVNGEADGILSWHPDRLARNAVDAGKIVHLIDTNKLLSLKFPTYWFEPTPQGLFMLSIAFGQSKYYSDSLSENVKRGIRQKLRRGEYPGYVPPGYLNDPRSRKVVKDPQRFKGIKAAFRVYATGKYTYTDISRLLAKKKVFGRKNNKPLAIEAVRRFLSNSFYYGHFRYKGELYEGTHEPMISKKLFDKVQKIRDQKSKKTRPQKALKPFPYRGLLTCDECGKAITTEKHIKKSGLVFRYYRCTKKGRKCYQPYLREEELTRQINQLIRKVSLPENWIEKMYTRLRKEEKQENQILDSFVQEKKEELDKLEQKLEKLLDSHLDGLVSKEEYKKKKSKLLTKKIEIEETLKILKQKKNHCLEPMKKWILAVESAQSTAESKNLQKKAHFAQMIGSNWTLKDKKVGFSWQKPWAALTRRPTSRNWSGW